MHEPEDYERYLLATSPEVERRGAWRALAIGIAVAAVAFWFLCFYLFLASK